MSVNLFFEHFATLATAPDGIARLRELILQLAVQGKLGTQDARDEPGILHSNSSRKVKLKKLENEEENPFTIPKNWKWVRVCDLGSTQTGITPSKSNPIFFGNFIPFVKPADINCNGLNYNGEGLSKEGLEEGRLIQKNSIIMVCIGGSIGKTGFTDIEISCNQQINALTPFENLNPKYFFFAFRTPYFQDLVWRYATFGSLPIINKSTWEQIPVPLPPIAEQDRIVAKVDRLMVLCDELEARQQRERASYLKLGTASLAGLRNAESQEEFGRQWTQVCGAFDLILDCPDNVAMLRQTILQLAVQGKLRTQEPRDAPAILPFFSERKTKTKKSMNEAEIPFTIPEKWSWVQVGNLGFTQTGTTPSKSNLEFIGDYIPFIKPADITNKGLNYLGEGLSKEGLEEGCLIQKNSIIMVCIGGSIGKTGFVDKDISCNQQINALTPNEKNDPKYFLIAFRAPYFQQLVWKFASIGSLPIINKSKWEQIPVPLPPFAEQHRIVAKVDAMMALCDALESRLKERAATQAKFTSAVVKQVAG